MAFEPLVQHVMLCLFNGVPEAEFFLFWLGFFHGEAETIVRFLLPLYTA